MKSTGSKKKRAIGKYKQRQDSKNKVCDTPEFETIKRAMNPE